MRRADQGRPGLLGRLRGPGELTLAVILFALTAPLVRWLVLHGGSLGISRPGAVSFCNVLFVGNLCAGLLMLGLFGPRRLARDFRAQRPKSLGLLAAAAVLGVAIPSLLFTALGKTTVTSLVLVGRAAGVAAAVPLLIGFREAGGRRRWAGEALVAVGVVVALWAVERFTLLAGDGLVLIAAFLVAIDAGVSGRFLRGGGSMRLLIFARTGVSAVAFFVIAVVFFGFHHFSDAFSPELWVVMSLYAFGVVILGQLAWLRSVERFEPMTFARALIAAPVLGLLFAHLLLGEAPTTAQLIAATAIVAGMALSATAPAVPESAKAGAPRTPEQTLAGG